MLCKPEKLMSPMKARCGLLVLAAIVALGGSVAVAQNLDQGKPAGEGGKALSHTFPRFADDLAWWMEAARAQREKQKPPY